MSILRQKLLASGIHLAIGLSVVLSFLLFCYFVLYTPEILWLEGGTDVALIILAVDLAVGPILTFIVYRRGKPGLVFDLTLIALVQTAAFAYGAWALYSQRPLYLAFEIEHFSVIAASEIDLSRLEDETLRPHPMAGPRPVYVVKPTENEERTRIMFEAGLGGKDIRHHPEYYRHVIDHLDAVRSRSYTLEDLRERTPRVVPKIEESLTGSGRSAEDVLFAPIDGHIRSATVMLDRDTGEILDYIDVSIPWRGASDVASGTG